MKKPKAGQILYSLNVGSAARCSAQKLTPVEVVKVGRKYFTCRPVGGKEYEDVQYHMDGWREKTNYSPDSVLYDSEIAYWDEKESMSIAMIIGVAFEHGRNRKKLSLEKLREIKRILEEA